MNQIKNLFKIKEEKEYKKRGNVRAFVVQADNPLDLLHIPGITTKINPNGFLNYYEEVKDVISHKELKERARNEFKENSENGVCYILCNEDVPCVYPEKPSVVNKRYPGIKILHLKHGKIVWGNNIKK